MARVSPPGGARLPPTSGPEAERSSQVPSLAAWHGERCAQVDPVPIPSRLRLPVPAFGICSALQPVCSGDCLP